MASVAYSGFNLSAMSKMMTYMAVVFLLLLVMAGLKTLFFRYQLYHDAIEIRRGVVFRKQLDMKFERIQNVIIQQAFYFRPLNLYTVKIDGAGSQGEEISLPALTREAANAIRQNIELSKRSQDQSLLAQGDDAAVDVSEGRTANHFVEEKFYTRSLSDLVIHGLSNNRAWIVLAGIYSLVQVTPISFSDIFDYLRGVAATLISNESVAFLLVLFSLSIFLTVVLTAVLSVMGSIVTYYGFTLFRSPKTLTVHRGLLTKREINMNKSRVQSIYLRQDWLDKILHRGNVIFEQLSHGPHQATGSDSGAKILVPSARDEEIHGLYSEVFSVDRVTELNFTPISKRYFYKHAIIWSVIYCVVSPVSFFVLGSLMAIPALAGLWLIHITALYLSWLKAGIVMSKEMVVIRSGVIGVDYVVFPAFKLQAVEHRQSLLMQRRDLSKMVFHTASRTASISYLPTQFVQQLLDKCLYYVESSDKSWM
ncbi:MAG: hypothetical protein COC19_07390 [SAR86 cluster bacterium]|uniref:YdbS-like PH domain-containing protein n=1 Tax=SAR86 cluster bacterium TaxID=2030880 RepID=A0A2A4MH70_9GAMM|nr:MAG: hypothetical protein COC19_07390 [SAR86 cluster bacterium]